MSDKNEFGAGKAVTKSVLLLALVIGVIAFPGTAYAITCATPAGTGTNLTAGGSATLDNGAIVTTNDSQSTGSGVVQSFVRIAGTSACEQGYNTGGRPLQFDENTSATFTRNLLLVDVPIVTIGGIQYREFLLDINQTAASPLLSLEQLQLWQASEANLLGFTAGSGFSTSATDTLVYSLDSITDKYLILNYSLNSGSGSGDLFFYIPNALFAGAPYLYLFSEFGEHNANNDGYEEWAVRIPTVLGDGQTPIPEPASLLLLGTGLAVVARRVRSKGRS